MFAGSRFLWFFGKYSLIITGQWVALFVGFAISQ